MKKPKFTKGTPVIVQGLSGVVQSGKIICKHGKGQWLVDLGLASVVDEKFIKPGVLVPPTKSKKKLKEPCDLCGEKEGEFNCDNCNKHVCKDCFGHNCCIDCGED